MDSPKDFLFESLIRFEIGLVLREISSFEIRVPTNPGCRIRVQVNVSMNSPEDFLFESLIRFENGSMVLEI